MRLIEREFGERFIRQAGLYPFKFSKKKDDD
jgi:hypothetical protein